MNRLKPAFWKRLLVVVGVFVFVFWAGASSFAYDYQPTEIAPLAGYESSRALGINNAGEVVGRFYNLSAETDEAVDRRAFIWDRIRGARLLPTLSGESSAWGINNNGMVSGYAYTSEGNQHGVLWDSSENTIIDIGTLTNTTTGSTGPTSTAYDLNDLSQVAGNADLPNDAGTFTPFHAFLYGQVSGIQDLGTFTTSFPEWQNGYSIAYSVNNHGEAVGIAHDSSWAFLPFIHDDLNGMRQLATDPAYSDPDDEWYAVAINDDGLIGGHVIADTNQSIPFYWPDKTGAPVLIPMPIGFPYGEIYGINASGQMVGIMWDSDQDGATEHAFVFDVNQGVQDLNSLIDPGSGWVLNFARDINDSGQIVGYGEKNGLKRGFVLSPTLPTQAPDELVCDFGSAYGVWHYDQAGGWTQLSAVDPGLMVAADVDNDGLDELAVAFSGYGLFIYDQSSGWYQINTVLPQAMIPYGHGLAVDFGSSHGLWHYTQSSGWTQLNMVDPGVMVAIDVNNDGFEELAVAFSGYGLFIHDPSSGWYQINTVLPQAMIRHGSGLAVDYGSSFGLWHYDQTGGWKQRNPADPANIVAVDINHDGIEELCAGFSGYGFLNYENGLWVSINGLVPEEALAINLR